jgi:hypothetical protein
LVVKAALEQQGFHPFTANQYTKVIDPFITGGNVFEAVLQVPAAEAKAAAAAIAALRRRTEPAVQEAGVTGEPPETGESVLSPLDILGRRLRWAALGLLVIGTLLALFFPAISALGCMIYFVWASDYLLRARRATTRAVGHGLTVACFFLVAAFLVVFVLFWLWPAGRGG